MVEFARLEDVPLHGDAPREEWACSEPEAPWDPAKTYDARCPACLIHATAVLRNQGSQYLGAKEYTDGDGNVYQAEKATVDLETFIRDGLEWQQLPPAMVGFEDK